MKPVLVLGALLLASCTATFAETTKAQDGATKVQAEPSCEPTSVQASTQATEQTVLIASAALHGAKPEDPISPEKDVLCPGSNTCTECGVPSFNFDDPGCVPGTDMGLTSCGHLTCFGGQTIHHRVCPCVATGCTQTWSTSYCAEP
jgi:hypothetical protein